MPNRHFMKQKRKFKFMNDKEVMVVINALNHYSRCEDVQNLMGLELSQFNQLVDDFKSFGINCPGGLDPFDED